MLDTHDKWPCADGLRIGFLNINHVINKLSDVSYILFNSGKCFHVFGFAETRLSKQISDTDLHFAGYNLLRRDPFLPGETGLLIYIHESISFKYLTDIQNHNIESLWLEIYLKQSKPITIGYIYRNPSEHVNWIDKFISMMENVCTKSTETILLGDFNIDLTKHHKLWTESYKSFNLTQIIDRPTRITPNSQTLIDHIYTTSTHTVIETCSPSLGTSDHNPVCFTWSKRGIKIPKNSHKYVQYRNFSSFDKDLFLFDLNNSPLSTVYQFTEPDHAFEVWYHTFLNVYNKHVPVKTKRVKSSPKQPWLTNELIDAMKLRDSLLQKGQFEDYKKQRNYVTKLKRNSKKKYFENLISSKTDSKSIWKAINQLTNKNTQPPPHKDISAKILNSHFCNITNSTIKIDKSNENDLEILRCFCNSKRVSKSLNVPFLGIHEVYKSITNLKPTATRGLDGIDGFILKLSAPVIADTLTYVYNLCISKNQFPKALKVAKIIPIFKNGEKNNPSNYRPISILPNLSKPLENHINTHLLNHFNTYKLFHDKQSGFRQHHSCHTALTNIVDQCLGNINNDEITGLLIVDFMKAFDVIDHNLLLRKLELYGLSHCTLKLMASFLSDRKQSVSINDTQSPFLGNMHGVPQGSVLGPVLFSIYINDLPISVRVPCELFADDTTLHTSHANPINVYSSLQSSIDDIVQWSQLNHMRLHPDKTKYMIITTRQKRQNISLDNVDLRIEGNIIEEVDHHKILGVIIDNNLNWSHHISLLCKTIATKIHQLSKMKHFVDLHSRNLFFNAYIVSHINYASTLWDSASEKKLKPLMSIYRRAIKLVLLKSSSLSPSDYKKTNILPLKWKLQYNKAVFMFKIMSNLAPPSLKNAFELKPVRDKWKIRIPLPRIDLFKSSLIYSGGHLWNCLPALFHVPMSIN